MERIKVSANSSNYRQIQGSVSEFNSGERFTQKLLELGNIKSPVDILKKMSCLRLVNIEMDRSYVWEKTFDPRTGNEVLPVTCLTCHFFLSRSGCEILEAHLERFLEK